MTNTALNIPWNEIDLPVLQAASVLCGKSNFGKCTAWEIASYLDWDHSRVALSIKRLSEQYLNAIDQPTGGGPDYTIDSLTADGMRMVGIWPDPRKFEEVVLQYIVNEIDNNPVGSPNAERLTMVKDTLSGANAGLIAAAAAKLFGLNTP